jgi:hypothetical protein
MKHGIHKTSNFTQLKSHNILIERKKISSKNRQYYEPKCWCQQEILTSTLIMIPDKSLSLEKFRKSDNLMKFPAFIYLGFLSKVKVLNGVDIFAVRMENNQSCSTFSIAIKESNRRQQKNNQSIWLTKCISRRCLGFVSETKQVM